MGIGLVGSLSRPGGNITGLSVQSAEIAGKRVALLRDIVPDFRRLAILANISCPIGVMETSEIEVSGPELGVEPLHSKSGERRKSSPPSRRSKAAQMRFMS